MATQLIQSNPAVMMGKPVVTGTRVTVEQILQSHPRLTRESVLAAIAFGAQALRADVTYPLAEPAI